MDKTSPREWELWTKWTKEDIENTWGWHKNQLFSDKARSEAAKWLSENCRSVLDVGCGGGIAGLRLKELNKNIQYHGIDITDDIISVAKKITGFSDESFSVSNIRDLISWDKKFDGVLVSHILEHHPLEELPELIKAIEHVTNKYVVVVFFNKPFDDDKDNIINKGVDGFYSNTYNQKYIDKLFMPMKRFGNLDYEFYNLSGQPERIAIYSV